MSTVRVVLPAHLRTLARVEEEVRLEVGMDPTIGGVLDALEEAHPMLRGTVREHGAGPRRAYIRFFACGEDWSHQPPDTPLPATVAAGREAFCVVGAIAGG